MNRVDNRPPSSFEAKPEDTRGLRSDLRKLVALEWTQTALGIGLLAAVAVRAVVMADDDSVAAVLTIVGMLAMVFLTLALRIRMGHESLRRDLQEIEIRHELARSSPEPGGSPYRDRIIPLARGRELPQRRSGSHLRRTG
jgi:hypothetical protein